MKNSIRVKEAIHRAQVLISAIPETKEAIKKYHKLDSILIPETGCYIDEKLKYDYARFNDKSKFNILWVGKFDFRKQPDLALKSIASVKTLPGLKLHVVGNGSEKQIKKFKSTVSELGIDNIVVWHGTLSNVIVLELMRCSHLFYFTSVSEDTSTVVLEALSSHLPVLCFNACGFGPIINQSVGAKVEISNPKQSVKDFAIKIEHLYNNRDELRTMSSNCASRQQKYSWDRKVQQMISLYQRAIDDFKDHSN
jgi:glycosyltransferase involved in cell wall biosynthesis